MPSPLVGLLMGGAVTGILGDLFGGGQEKESIAQANAAMARARILIQNQQNDYRAQEINRGQLALNQAQLTERLLTQPPALLGGDVKTTPRIRL